MRARAGIVVLALASGCGGWQEDAALKANVRDAVAAQDRGRPFPARELVPGEWQRLWFFGGYSTDESVDSAVGHDVDAPDQVPEADYLVVVDYGPQDTKSFILELPAGVYLGCLPYGSVMPSANFARYGPVPEEPETADQLDYVAIRDCSTGVAG